MNKREGYLETQCWKPPKEYLAIRSESGKGVLSPVLRNNCGGRIYVRARHEVMYSVFAKPYSCRIFAPRDGAYYSFWTRLTNDPTGRLHVRWVGSKNPAEDCACTQESLDWDDGPHPTFIRPRFERYE